MSSAFGEKIFGSLSASPKVIEIISTSPTAVSLLNEYQIEYDAERYLKFKSNDGNEEFSSSNKNAAGFFQAQVNGKPGYISLKQSELDRSPHLAAEYIIHELAHFKFRAANAQMMDAVNRNDPTAYLNAYLLREAQAEALTDRAPAHLTVTPLDNGLTERRLTLGNGVELASVRDDDRRVLRASYQRDDTDSWLRQSSTLRTESTDPETGERITHENRTTYASDGYSVTGREDTSGRHDAGGQSMCARWRRQCGSRRNSAFHSKQ